MKGIKLTAMTTEGEKALEILEDETNKLKGVSKRVLNKLVRVQTLKNPMTLRISFKDPRSPKTDKAMPFIYNHIDAVMAKNGAEEKVDYRVEVF